MKEKLKMFLDENDEIDYVALKFHPHEVEHLTPITSIADGNCFPRSLSMLMYGNQSSHVEMHIGGIIVEGGSQQEQVFKTMDICLIDSCKDLVSQYCLYSGSLVPCNRLIQESICTTYEKKLMDNKKRWKLHGDLTVSPGCKCCKKAHRISLS